MIRNSALAWWARSETDPDVRVRVLWLFLPCEDVDGAGEGERCEVERGQHCRLIESKSRLASIVRQRRGAGRVRECASARGRERGRRGGGAERV